MVNNTKITSGQLKKFMILNRVNKKECGRQQFKRPRKKTKINSLASLLGKCSVNPVQLPRRNGTQSSLQRIINNLEKQSKQQQKNKRDRKIEIERQKRLMNNRKMKELLKSLKKL